MSLMQCCFRRTCTLLLILTALIDISKVTASYADATGDDDTLEQAERSSETVIAVFSFLCSVIISFFSLVLAHYASLEDGVVKLYKKHGLTVRAKVRSSTVARSSSMEPPTNVTATTTNTTTCIPLVQECEQEHVAEVEYKYPGPELSEARIRKQVKVLGCDLIKKDVPSAIQIQVDLEDEGEEFSLSNGDKSSSEGLHDIEIFVLKGFKRSGFPKQQIERMSQIRYRVPTVFMVVLTLLLSLFCLYVAISTVSDDDHMSNAAALGLIQLTVLGIQSLFIQAFLGRPMQKMVQEEYLQSGALIDEGDASTISSGDGSYMLL